jgi:hypothetical protein
VAAKRPRGFQGDEQVSKKIRCQAMATARWALRFEQKGTKRTQFLLIDSCQFVEFVSLTP